MKPTCHVGSKSYIDDKGNEVSIFLFCFRNYVLQRFVISAGLEITVGCQTLTDGNAILSNGTFLPSDAMTADEL